jgi:hypothetical protein
MRSNIYYDKRIEINQYRIIRYPISIYFNLLIVIFSHTGFETGIRARTTYLLDADGPRDTALVLRTTLVLRPRFAIRLIGCNVINKYRSSSQ